MMYIYGDTLRCIHCDYTGLYFLLSSITRFHPKTNHSSRFNPKGNKNVLSRLDSNHDTVLTKDIKMRTEISLTGINSLFSLKK